MTSSSWKEIEEIDTTIGLMQKLLSSSKESDDLSIGFHGSIEAQERKVTKTKQIKGIFLLEFFLKDVFGFAEHEYNCTYGLGYTITLHRNSDNHVSSHPAGFNDAANLALTGRVIMVDTSLYALHYIPNISNQEFLLRHIVSRAATEISYFKGSSYIKDTTTEDNWTFEFGVGDGSDIPIYVLVEFMQRDQFNQQHQNNDAIYRTSVVNAQCVIGSEKYADAGTNCKYAIDKFSQAYGETVSWFRHLGKDNILQPYFTQKDFVTLNIYSVGHPGYILYVFHIRHHQDLSSARTIQVRFDFRPAVPLATNLTGHALLLTNKLVSVSSDNQRQFELVWVIFIFLFRFTNILPQCQLCLFP